MRRLAVLLFTLCALSLTAQSQGVNYFKGTVYEGLNEAQKTKKLLLVEFFAHWSHKSRWMNENVIAKSPDLNDNFVVCQIDTRSEKGAALANEYQVTDYPNILIFNANGSVVDRIDRALSVEDFKGRIYSLVASMDGRSAWQLRQIFDAADAGNRDRADKLMSEFITSQKVELITSPNNWDLFTNSDITFYGSAGYWFLMEHFAKFPSAEKADEVLEKIYIDAIMPYVIGTGQFDSVYVSVLSQDGAKFHSIAKLSALAKLRSENNYYSYVQLLGNVVDILPEQYEYPLIMSLDFVADGTTNGTHKSVRRSAYSLVEKLYSRTLSPAKISLIKQLLDKFL